MSSDDETGLKDNASSIEEDRNGASDPAASNQSSKQGGCSSFSKKWTNAITAVHRPITKGLKVVTRQAATYPKSCIGSIVLLSIVSLVVGIFTNLNVDFDKNTMWTPFGSRPWQHLKWLEDESGFPPDHGAILFFIHADGENVLGRDGVNRLFQAVDVVRETPGYESVCSRSITAGRCRIEGVTNFWDNNTTRFRQEATSEEIAINTMSAQFFPDGKPVDRHAIFGNPNPEETGTLVAAQGYMLHMLITDGSDGAAFELEALNRIFKVRDAWEQEPANNFRLATVATRSLDDELQRSVEDDIPLVPAVFFIMSIFTALVFSRRDRVKSQTLLGVGAVVCVVMSLMTGYGLLFLCGVPFTTISRILPFVIFGVGLDDSFIIAGAFERTDPRKNILDRIEETIENVGVTITITTVTTSLAFGMGCTSTIPTVYWLCLYAFPCILIDFLYQVTFFISLLVLDDQRIQKNRYDCCICIVANQGPGVDEDELEDEGGNTRRDDNIVPVSASGSFFTNLMTWHARQLMRPWVKAVVITLFLGLLAACVVMASELTQEFNFTDVLPSDSYVSDFYYATDDYSHQGPITPYVFFRDVDQSQGETQVQMEKFINDLVAMDEVTDQPAFFWLRHFKLFVSSDDSLSDLEFNDQIQAFLNVPVFAELYSDHIVLDQEGNIESSRCYIFMSNVDLEDVNDQIDALKNQRDVTDSQPINMGRRDLAFFTYSEDYNIWEFFSVAVRELIVSTILGVVTVSVVGLLLLPHWTAILYVAPLIVMLYIDLLGVLKFAGLHVNVVSYIALVMSIGLMVDFVMHVLLRYYEEPGNREEKILHALQSIGSSVLIGGVSTFLGVLALAFSSSEIFTTLFVAFLGLVTLGIGHGLILLPVLLSIFGTTECTLPTNRDQSNTAERTHPNEDHDPKAAEAR